MREMFVRWVHVDVMKRKLKYYSQHHVLMKGGKFMGAYFYSIILFVFSALFLIHLIHAACISNIVVMAVLLCLSTST
mgnify:FL=1